MRPSTLCALALTVAACNGETDSAGDAAITPQVTGDIAMVGQDAEGRVEIFKAYGIDQGGRVMLYLSSNPDLTCPMAAELLSTHDGPFDPTDYIVGGTCDFFIKKDEYDGVEMTFTDDPFGRAGWAINCFTGDGAFEFQDRTDGGDDGIYWTGRKWLGYPTVYSYTITGGNEEPYTLQLDLQEYDGGFPEEGLDSYPATGSVVGTVEAQWCPDLGRTSSFSGG